MPETCTCDCEHDSHAIDCPECYLPIGGDA